MNLNPGLRAADSGKFYYFRLVGNIVPDSWLQHIKTPSGRPDEPAIFILSDIVRWYQPKRIIDERTGRTVGTEKKFKADKLQRTYKQYTRRFGYSRARVKTALDKLESLGLVTREFRNIKTEAGIFISNVMFIEPVLENVAKISNEIRSPQIYEDLPLKTRGTYPQDYEDLPLKPRGTPPQIYEDPPLKTKGTSPQKPGGPPPKNHEDLPPKTRGTSPQKQWGGPQKIEGTYTENINNKNKKTTTEIRSYYAHAREEAAAAAFLESCLSVCACPHPKRVAEEDGWGAAAVFSDFEDSRPIPEARFEPCAFEDIDYPEDLYLDETPCNGSAYTRATRTPLPGDSLPEENPAPVPDTPPGKNVATAAVSLLDFENPTPKRKRPCIWIPKPRPSRFPGKMLPQGNPASVPDTLPEEPGTKAAVAAFDFDKTGPGNVSIAQSEPAASPTPGNFAPQRNPVSVPGTPPGKASEGAAVSFDVLKNNPENDPPVGFEPPADIVPSGNRFRDASPALDSTASGALPGDDFKEASISPPPGNKPRKGNLTSIKDVLFGGPGVTAAVFSDFLRNSPANDPTIELEPPVDTVPSGDCIPEEPSAPDSIAHQAPADEALQKTSVSPVQGSASGDQKPKAAVVSPKDLTLQGFMERVPPIYRNHRDVFNSLSQFLASQGPEYVETELEYTLSHSTKPGGFPAYLSRALHDGWGTQARETQAALEAEKKEKARLLREREREEQLKRDQKRALIEAEDAAYDERVKEVVEQIPTKERESLEAKARAEAEREMPLLRLGTSEKLSAAREILETLSSEEKDHLHTEAVSRVKAVLGDFISETRPDLKQAIENQMLMKVLERYPLKTPITSKWDSRVLERAGDIFKRLVMTKYEPIGTFSVAGVT